MYSMMNNAYFVQDGQKVRTPGIDWGGPLLQIYRIGKFRVWHKPTRTVWAGRFGQRATAPSAYFLVRVRGERVECLEEVEPGRAWKKTRDRLIGEAMRLAKQMRPT